jgi:tetratricopeptide (TPR) repeat protein
MSQSLQQIDSLLIDARYQAAIDAANEALRKSPSEPSLILNRKAEGLIQSGNFKEAENVLTTAKDQCTSPLHTAVTDTNYGLLYLNIGRNDLAQQSLESAVTIFDQQQLTTTLDRAKALSYMGQYYNVLGKTSQAQEQLMMSLSIRQKLLPEKHELIAASYNDLGLSYVRVDNDKALDYYDKALALYQALHGNEHPKIAIANINSGFVYRELELYGDAVNNFETALKIWEKLFTAPHPSKAFALLNLGQTYLRMNDKKAARGYFDRALQMYRDVYGQKHPDIANVLNQLGNLEISSDNYTSALDFYQQALVANIKGFDNAEIFVNPPVDDFYNGKVLLFTLHFKAQAFEKKYFGHSLKLTELQTALSTLELADKLIDKLRQQTSNESDKLTLGAIANEVYADGVRIAFEIAQNALAKRSYFEKSFYFSEKSKSAVLLEAISDTQAKSYAGIPSELLDREKALKSEMALVAQKLSQKPTAEEEKALRESSFSLNKEYQTFVKKLESEFPQYFNLKYNSTAPAVKDLQSLLDEKTAVTSYFIDEKNRMLYLFVVTQNKFTISDRALPETFDKYITGFRNAIYFNDIRTFLKAGSVLSEALVPKLPSRISNVVVIPTGRLSIIPFEALLTGGAKTNNYGDLPYLIRKASIRYEFSAALLLQKGRTPATKSSSAIMLCAPVTFEPDTQLPELPATEAEVNVISDMFSARNLVASVKIGSNANETAVKEKNTGEYGFLHFATHGVVDEINPELSRIFLQRDQATDGNLFSGEIYNLQLNANLVTLSACQTGLGKISKGEGVIGLSRALVYAGARNVIVSFWSVADQSTADLMKDFYQDLLGEPNVEKWKFCESLKAAKLKMIGSDAYNAPYYWAPFILIGY